MTRAPASILGGNLADRFDAPGGHPLFDKPAPAHVDAGPTERAASKRATRRVGTLRDRVYRWIKAAGDEGMTTKEARARFAREELRDDGYSIPSRFTELRVAGLIVAHGLERDGALVYTATLRDEGTPRS